MKTIIHTALIGFILFLASCASDPLMSGLPQDWQGKNAEDLRRALGEPTRIISASNGAEIWEYRQTGDFIAPGEENTSFRMGAGGGSGLYAASGGIKTLKSGERQAHFENVVRFKIKNEKVKEWYAERIVDGQKVWSDH